MGRVEHNASVKLDEGRFCGMVGRSKAMRRVYAQIERFASTPIPILIVGETGSGKDEAARAIHHLSGSGGPYVVVSCGALAPTLIESELFGHERGAFTGATRTRKGLVAEADGGILFLDEIAELPLAAQAKLLRVIETGEYRRVGCERSRVSRFRLIAATHRDLDQMVRETTFRRDLLFRLGTARLRMPPLRERLEDLPLLVSEFLRRHRTASGDDGPRGLTAPALLLLKRFPWPGNVRELRSVIEAAAAVAEGEEIVLHELAEFLPNPRDLREQITNHGQLVPLSKLIAQTTVAAIAEALRRTEGDRDAAARLLGISRATLYRRLGPNGSNGKSHT